MLGVVAPLSDEIHSPSLSSSSSEPLPSREASVKPALCLPLPLVVPTAPVVEVCRERGGGWRGAKADRLSRLATRAVLLVRPSVDCTRVADCNNTISTHPIEIQIYKMTHMSTDRRSLRPIALRRRTTTRILLRKMQIQPHFRAITTARATMRVCARECSGARRALGHRGGGGGRRLREDRQQPRA